MLTDARKVKKIGGFLESILAPNAAPRSSSFLPATSRATELSLDLYHPPLPQNEEYAGDQHYQ
jgi:hypothetical protein